MEPLTSTQLILIFLVSKPVFILGAMVILAINHKPTAPKPAARLSLPGPAASDHALERLTAQAPRARAPRAR